MSDLEKRVKEAKDTPITPREALMRMTEIQRLIRVLDAIRVRIG